MAPKLYLDQHNSAEPVQIVSKPLEAVQEPTPRKSQKRLQIVWRNVLIFFFLHLGAIYGLYAAFSYVQWKTVIYLFSSGFLVGQGITAGAHRLWAHRTYKAKLPLRIFLAIMQTSALQNHIYEWVRDHRVHHKFTDTDADPHNVTRGFFFSHMGWLLVKKHKDVFTKGKTVDLSDLEADPVVMFQKKYYVILAPIFCFLIPPLIPWYFWNEDPILSFFSAGVFRYVISLHVTWLVNSAAHIWGNKPYDKNIKATENLTVGILAYGEGWHNYHHVFPWDYKAAELGNYSVNMTTGFLDLMAKIGWAYDLKTVSNDMIQKRVKRTGDGTLTFKEDSDDGADGDHDNSIWGWGDSDMRENDKKLVQIHYQKN